MSTEKVTYALPNGTAALPTELLNLAEVDVAWVARRAQLRCYAPVATGVVRVEALPGRPARFGGYYIQCLHAHDGTGLLLYCDYEDATVRWYSYGCAHQYRELSRTVCDGRNIYHGGRCYHVSECDLCGYIDAHDSSD